ncbi:MAG: DegV family protein [Clostridia bacterium]|nr:DegV family protein [Oscillospiraceae bacterium]MBQ2750139.1 DegV family protein [Clostridia bacterium]
MKILFSTDSTADLSKELLDQYHIPVLPLYVQKGGVMYRDGVDITVKDIFEYVGAGNPICSTAALNIGDYEEFFGKYASEYDAVIHTIISSEFSSCYQNAVIAAQSFDNVYVVDSRNLSTGIALVVLEGIDMAKAGMAPADIAKAMEDVTAKVETSFVLNTLEYLAKGGRCSSVTALGANLLKLRPVIEVQEGKMQVGKKYRGAYNKCVVNYVVDRLKDRTDIKPTRIFITHAHCAPELVAEVRKAVEATGIFAEIHETLAGCSVSSHCGPDCLGVLFVRK